MSQCADRMREMTRDVKDLGRFSDLRQIGDVSDSARHSSSSCLRLQLLLLLYGACLRDQLSTILSNQSPESYVPRIDRGRSFSAAAGGFGESVKNVAEQLRSSCNVNVGNVSVDKRRVNEDADVGVRRKGRNKVGSNGGYGFDDDLDRGLGGEVKTLKEHMDDDWRSKKKKNKDKQQDKKNKKKDATGVDLGSLWKKTSSIHDRFSKWKMRRKRSKGSGEVSSVDGGDLSNAVVKLREKDLIEVRESEAKVTRRSCDAVLVSNGRGSFDGSRGLAGKPRVSLDVNLVERSYGFQRLKFVVSDVSDVKEDDNLAVKRPKNPKNLNPVIRSDISQDDCFQDSDESSEGLVSRRLRRGLDRIISNMTLLSPLQVKKVRETSSSRSSPSKTKPHSKLLITEKELMEWSSKTRNCTEQGVEDSSGCVHSHFVEATPLRLSTMTAKWERGANKESPQRRNQRVHYSPCSLANGMPKFVPVSSIENSQ